jgi:hypothetical protein
MNANALTDGVKDANIFATYLTLKQQRSSEISAKGPQEKLITKQI